MSATEKNKNPVSDEVRFDRRLTNRRGWIDEAAREEYLRDLPDVADKIEPPSEEPAEE